MIGFINQHADYLITCMLIPASFITFGYLFEFIRKGMPSNNYFEIIRLLALISDLYKSD